MFELMNNQPLMYPDGDDVGSAPTGNENPPAVGDEGVKNEPFDPTKLSPEVQKYIDQERTRASKTAREKTRKKLENDPDFRNNIRDEIQREANLTAEEKLLEREREFEESERKLAIRQNKLEAKERLITSGLTGVESIEGILDAITVADPEMTISNADALVKAIDSIVTDRVTKEKQALLQNGLDIDVGKKGAKSYQQLYNEAKTTQARVRIKREAFEKGVTLQE